MDHGGTTEFLTPGQVARVLQVSPKTVSRWAAQGLLPCMVTLGGHRRFRREQVEEVHRRMAAGHSVADPRARSG